MLFGTCAFSLRQVDSNEIVESVDIFKIVKLLPNCFPLHTKDFKMYTSTLNEKLVSLQHLQYLKSSIFFFFCQTDWQKLKSGCSWAFVLLLMQFAIFLLTFHHLFIDICNSSANCLFIAFTHLATEIWAFYRFFLGNTYILDSNLSFSTCTYFPPMCCLSSNFICGVLCHTEFKTFKQSNLSVQHTYFNQHPKPNMSKTAFPTVPTVTFSS